MNRIDPTHAKSASGPKSVDTAQPRELSAPKLVRNQPHHKPLLFRAALFIRESAMRLRLWYLRRIAKMDVHPNVRISLRASLDFTNPRGVHIGEGTYIAFHAVIFAHDMSRVLHTDTYIGRNCFIGTHSVIMPGVRIGDECIVASGSIVTKDVPSHSIVAGNPAKVVRSGIRTRMWGILEDAYAEAIALEENVQRPSTNDV